MSKTNPSNDPQHDLSTANLYLRVQLIEAQLRRIYPFLLELDAAGIPKVFELRAAVRAFVNSMEDSRRAEGLPMVQIENTSHETK